MWSRIGDHNNSGVSGDTQSESVATTNCTKENRKSFEHNDRNDIDADSTRSSSPFISNPELIKTEEISFTASPINEKNSISRRVQDMDTSIASLKDSMASIKFSDKENVDISKNRDSTFQNSTMDTTQYNETQAQLDRDLDIDQSDLGEKILSSKYKKGPSPWKQLRSTSTATSLNMRDIPKLQFNQPILFNNDARQSVITDNAAIAKINELNKQVTGYRIQIKLFKQFLQNLIDKTRYGSNEGVDISELNNFQNHLSGLSPSKSTGLSSLQNESFHHGETLSQDYDELLKLNDDLYANLEDFRNKLHEKEAQLHKVNEYMNDCSRLINDIISLLINDRTTDDAARQALLKLLNSEGEGSQGYKPLDTKLYVIQLELNRRLDDKVTYPTPPPSNPEKQQGELTSYISIIQELITSLDKLQGEFTAHKHDTSKLRSDLKQEVISTQAIKANYETLYNKFNNLCITLENSRPKDVDDEINKLRLENQKLKSINSTVDKKFDEYQTVIDKLQQEVNEFQTHCDNNSASELLKYSNDELYQKDLLQSHKEVNELQEQLNNLTERYRKLQEDSSKTISTLTNQLHAKNQDKLSQSANFRVTEQLKNDLEIAVEKQRILKAEKVRLSYSIEALTNDKASLHSTIRSLTDKITSLTIEAQQRNNEDISETALKKLNVLEYQLSDLLLRDVYEFQKFLKSFVKIADDSSLKEPKRKIDSLSKKISLERDADTDEKLILWDISELNKIREYHKSVFDYFARAVDIIVNDHVKLLLKDSEHTSQTSEYVNKLHKRIDELNDINDSLTRQLDTYYPDDSSNDTTQNTTVTSMSAKMRIAELTNRWKSEREARVYENQEAQKRLRELDIENARLRQELDQVS